MRIIIVRHGDPDYEHDTITEKGRTEVRLLKERIVKLRPDKFYVSPLGRARDTAQPSLTALGASAVTLDWLREFDGVITDIDDPEHKKTRIPWDLKPSFWTEQSDLYSTDGWIKNSLMSSGNVRERFERVSSGLDSVISDFGYRRCGRIYKVERESRDTAVFFCHFGVECVMLSHLLGISPILLWHGFIALPSSVTTLVTEEREEGTAYFRCLGFGDISHLYAGGEGASFSGRFCETYSSKEERH